MTSSRDGGRGGGSGASLLGDEGAEEGSEADVPCAVDGPTESDGGGVGRGSEGRRDGANVGVDGQDTTSRVDFTSSGPLSGEGGEGTGEPLAVSSPLPGLLHSSSSMLPPTLLVGFDALSTDALAVSAPSTITGLKTELRAAPSAEEEDGADNATSPDREPPPTPAVVLFLLAWLKTGVND